MNYTAAISDFFKSPKWGMNLLWGGVCILIPFVGPIVLSGWHVTGFWGRKDQDPASFPEFDFNQFGKYLERGIWPFLAALVVTVVILPVIMAVMIAMMAGLFSLKGPNADQELNQFAVMLGVFLIFALTVALNVLISMVQVPPVLSAAITQDFAATFNFGFFKRFVGLVWKEMITTAIFLLVAGMLLGFAGMLACYFGAFFTLSLWLFATHHLQKQLYGLYLSRGGEAIPPSSKLALEPPPLPVP